MSSNESAQKITPVVYEIKLKNGGSFFAEGEKALKWSMGLDVYKNVIAYFFIRLAGHRPEDMGIFSEE